MATASQPPADDPQRLLADTRRLAQRVRRAQRATGSALLVLGATVLTAIPFYEYGHSVVWHCQARAGGRVCALYPTLALAYWPVAMVLAYTLIGMIFVRQARSRGVGARVRPYVIGGIVLAVAATLITVHNLQDPLSWGDLGFVHVLPGSAAGARLYRLVSPLGVIGLGLLVLARVERSRALAAFSAVYLVAVAATAPSGFHSGRLFLPGVLVPGLVLLAGSAVFAILERPGPAGAP